MTFVFFVFLLLYSLSLRSSRTSEREWIDSPIDSLMDALILLSTK